MIENHLNVNENEQTKRIIMKVHECVLLWILFRWVIQKGNKKQHSLLKMFIFTTQLIFIKAKIQDSPNLNRYINRNKWSTIIVFKNGVKIPFLTIILVHKNGVRLNEYYSQLLVISHTLKVPIILKMNFLSILNDCGHW